MAKSVIHLVSLLVLLAGCAGVKVVNPNDANKDKGTKMLDLSSGSPKIVSTYSCKLQSMGKWVSAVAKTENEARKEALARCRDKTVISSCKEEKVTCTKN